jgi:predicted nucleic-acid-binding protein
MRAASIRRGGHCSADAREIQASAMIGLDANVLVRYLTHVDSAQYAKAAAFIEAATNRGEQFVLNTAVLCELVWVLDSAYEYSREEIATTLEQRFARSTFSRSSSLSSF